LLFLRLLVVLVLISNNGCVKDPPAASVVAGRVIGAHGLGPGHFFEPRAVATTRAGSLFAVDRSGRVQRFSPDGQFELQWEMPDNAPDVGKPSGICVDSDDRVLVADTHFHRVVAFDVDGREVFRFGELGTGPGQFRLPTDVAVDAHGDVYVCEYGGNDRVSRFDRNLRFISSFGGPRAGSDALQQPSGMAVDAQGRIWVADSGNHRLCCFDRDGRMLYASRRYGTEPDRFRYPRDIAITDDQRILVVDYGNDQIDLLDADGRFVAAWGEPGRGDGQLFRPINLALHGETLFIADSKNHRVLRVGLDAFAASRAGAPVTMASAGGQ